jgi:hypothetical protein
MIRVLSVPPIEDGDIRAFTEFLAADHEGREGVFHKLLQDHPALLGVLGYVRLLSELSVAKTPRVDTLITKPDRVDFLGARPSEVTPSVLYVDVIELKRPRAYLAQKADKRRLSSTASAAITQLHTYDRNLVESAENRDALAAIGLVVRQPRKILVMGSEAEFEGSSDAYESIRAQFRAAGIEHYTSDSLLRLAEGALRVRLAEQVRQCLPPNHLQVVLAGKTDFGVSGRGNEIGAAPTPSAVVSLAVLEWREAEGRAPCPRCKRMSLTWYGEGGAGLYGAWTCSECGYRNLIDYRFDSDYDPHVDSPV